MSCLITESYRKLNSELHCSNHQYGTTASRYSDYIDRLACQNVLNTILDYGCGKGLLKRGLGDTYEVFEYDPAIPGKDEDPGPAELVVCIDVLEHVEPECIDAVLAHMASKTDGLCFVTISLRPAKKLLGDGRNAHILLRSTNWWLRKVMEHFRPISMSAERDTLSILMEVADDAA